MIALKTFAPETKTMLSNFMKSIYIFNIFHHLRAVNENKGKVWKGKILAPRELGPIQTLLLWNQKILNFGVRTRPLESASKMIQKSKLWGSMTRNFLDFSIWNFETLTRFCGNTVFWILNLTCASARAPRDLVRLVLWRYTNMVMIWVFMISLNWSNRRLFQIRNHKIAFKELLYSEQIENIWSI